MAERKDRYRWSPEDLAGLELKSVEVPYSLPVVPPETVRNLGLEHYEADVIILRRKKPAKDVLIINSPKAYEALKANTSHVERGIINEEMGNQTNGNKSEYNVGGAQFANLGEREQQKKEHKGRKAHSIIGQFLSEVGRSSGTVMEEEMVAVLEEFVGKEFDPQKFIRELIVRVTHKVLFAPVFTVKDVRMIAEFIPISFIPFTIAAFGKQSFEGIVPIMRLLAFPVYAARDILLWLIANKVEKARNLYPDSVPVKIWTAHYKDGLVKFDNNKLKATKYARQNTASYMMSLFQAAADTTTGPGANLVALLSFPENEGLYDVSAEKLELAASATALAALDENSTLATDPRELTQDWSVNGEVFPTGTEVNFGLSVVAAKDLEEYAGVDLSEDKFIEVVEKLMNLENITEEQLIEQAKKSPAFLSGFLGECMGAALAVMELKTFAKVVYQHGYQFRVKTERKHGEDIEQRGEQKVFLLLQRQGAKVGLEKRQKQEELPLAA